MLVSVARSNAEREAEVIPSIVSAVSYLSGRACHSGSLCWAAGHEDQSSSRTSPTGREQAGFVAGTSPGMLSWVPGPDSYHHPLHRVLTPQSQAPRHLQPAVSPPGFQVVRAELESDISSVNQHLGDDDHRGLVSTAVHAHKDHRRRLPGLGQVPGLGAGWPALQT